MADAPITNHVVINLTAGAQAPEAFDFGKMMLLHEHTAFEGRLVGPLSQISDAADEGITSVAFPDLYNDLVGVFAQQINGGVANVYVGRKLPAEEPIGQFLVYDASAGTWADDTTDINNAGAADVLLFPATEEDELDYVAWAHVLKFGGTTWNSTGGTAGVGGAVALEYGRDLDSDGVLDDWQALTGVVDGTTGFTAAAGAGQAMTWTIPDDWDAGVLDPDDLDVEPPRYYVRARVTTVYGTNPVYTSAFIPGDSAFDDALDAIVALHGVDAFFGATVFDRTDAGIADLNAWAAANELKFIVWQTDSPALKAGTPGNVGLTAQAAGYRKSAGIYHRRDVDHLDTAWMARCLGKNMDAPSGKLNWKFRELVFADGPSVHLTATQIANIKAADVNLYARSLGIAITQEGVTPAGLPDAIDIVIAEMWLKRRLEEKGLALFVSKDVVGYDLAGMAYIEAQLYETLLSGVTFGHFTGDTPPRIQVPDPRTVSSAIKQSREVTITGEITHRGGVNKFTFELNVSF